MRKFKYILLAALLTLLIFILALSLEQVNRTTRDNNKIQNIRNIDNKNDFNDTLDSKQILQFDDGKKLFYYKENRKVKTEYDKVVLQLPLSRIYESIEIKDHFIFKTKTGDKLYIFIIDLGGGEKDFYVLNSKGQDIFDPDKLNKEILDKLMHFYNNQNVSRESIIKLLEKMDDENMI